MIINDIEPAVGEQYRSRQTGELVTLVAWVPEAQIMVLENPESRARRTCGVAKFWANYIHAKATVLP